MIEEAAAEGGVSKRAVFSNDHAYRYFLSWTWDARADPLVFIMLNPSTADASRDDPTLRRCMLIARANGWGGVEAVNLFQLRSPYPERLREAGVKRAVGPIADAMILKHAALHPRSVVVAWGAHGPLFQRSSNIAALLRSADIQPKCLGLTSHGEPRHPLGTGRTRLEPFDTQAYLRMHAERAQRRVEIPFRVS